VRLNKTKKRIKLGNMSSYLVSDFGSKRRNWNSKKFELNQIKTMSSSSSSPDIVSILENSKELDRLRKDQEDVLSEINKLHKKLQTS